MEDAMDSGTAIEAPLGGIEWMPPEGLERHAGGPCDPAWDFFAEPPPEIGPLVSAESNLILGKRPWRGSSRIVLIGLAGWATYMGIDAIAGRWPPADRRFFQRVRLVTPVQESHASLLVVQLIRR